MVGKKTELRGKRYAAALLFLLTLLVGCKQEDDVVVQQTNRHWVKKTVAIVAPQSDSAVKKRLERTAAWFLQNFREAQKVDTLAIDLELEWYDEDSEDLTALSQSLADRSDIIAVVGPFASDAVAAFAPACQKKNKPLIAPTITSEEIVRRYAVKNAKGYINEQPFLWSLTETDVSLTETLMSTYAVICQNYPDNRPEAVLFAPDDSYGQTFNYWAPFFANNYGIKLMNNELYTDINEVKEKMLSLFKPSEADPVAPPHFAVFSVVKSMQQLYDLAHLRRDLIVSLYSHMFANIQDTDPEVLDNCWQLFESLFRTYVAYEGLSEEQLESLGEKGVKMLQGYQGFSPYADPTTGFELSYRQRFGVLPTFAECKFYDALMLAAFSAFYIEHIPSTATKPTLNEAIITLTGIVDDSNITGSVWNTTAMQIYLNDLENGRMDHFIGASGDIGFDFESFTASTQTTYVYWQIMDGQIIHRSYYGAGGRRTAEATAAWNYMYDSQVAAADYDRQTANSPAITYCDLTDQYAVLVQGSQDFINYRHQGDALSVYQLLRKNGFPDDHIILIIDKSVALDPLNSEPGIIRASTSGYDLLGGTDGLPPAEVDYNNLDLNAADIADILLGNASDHLPTVLPRDAGQNVFFYWSGHGHSVPHGGADEFAWCHSRSGGFTSTMMRNTAQQMLNGQCRKLLMVAEPCYGEVVARSLEGITGALAICGASATEQSLADNWSNESDVWLSDRFSQNFVEKLMLDPQTTYRELFLYCARNTLGSHAKIVNAAHFGNLAATNPEEFIVYQK